MIQFGQPLLIRHNKHFFVKATGKQCRNGGFYQKFSRDLLTTLKQFPK